MFKNSENLKKICLDKKAEYIFVDVLNFAHDIQYFLPKDKQVKLDWLRFIIQKWLEVKWSGK